MLKIDIPFETMVADLQDRDDMVKRAATGAYQALESMLPYQE